MMSELPIVSSLPSVEVMNYPNDRSRKWIHYQNPEYLLLVASVFFPLPLVGERHFYKFILKKQLFKVFKSVFTMDVALFTNWKTINDVKRSLTGYWLKKWQWSQKRTLIQTLKVMTCVEWPTRSLQSRGTWSGRTVDGGPHTLFLA